MRSDHNQPNKSLGQHWLNDEPSLNSIVDSATLKNTDTVIEIGPGQGSLTKILTKKAESVIAVELDTELANKLKTQVNSTNLTVFAGDILKFNFSDIKPGYKIVANIPYYLTSNLIRFISELTNPPTLMVLLVQKEVAQRICAPPGKMSTLSVSAQFYWEASLGIIVASNLFTPPPKIDSQVVILKRRAEPLFKVNEADFFKIVKSAFSKKRKTLSNSLSSGLRLDVATVTKACSLAAIDSNRRPQTLSLSEWFNLYEALNA